jgi:hypothetical protein
MLTGTGRQVLRQLLADPHADPAELDWADARSLALRHGVIVRLADAVSVTGEPLPPRFQAAAAAACTRTQRALAIVDRLGANCDAIGVSHAFLYTAERYPDSGTVTLLVSAPRSRGLDRAILDALPAASGAARNLGNRLAGSSHYSTGAGIQVRIHHGRLGRLGEHARYARLLVERAHRVPVGSTSCRVPSPDDHCLLLAIARAYADEPPRLDDLAWTIPALWTQALDWDDLFATALSIGMLESVGAFLAWTNDVHHQLFGRNVVDAAVLSRFQGRSSHLRRLGAALEAGRWHSAARLSLRPLIAAVAARRTPRPA